MLTKINRIDNLGLVFKSFKWRAETAPFKKFNLIYGWNGCGKTTLTRLFDELLAPGGVAGVSYAVETDDAGSLTETDRFPTPVRVFNQHYVSTNLRVLEFSANKISILLGEENQELLAEIEKDEELLNGTAGDPDKIGLVRELQGYTRKFERLEKENGEAFKEIAKTISAATTGAGLATRSYRAPDARKDFDKVQAPKFLSDDGLNKGILSLRESLLPEEGPISLPSLDPDVTALNAIKTAHAVAVWAFPATVESIAISRLTANPDIATWVEEGVALHAQHASVNCEYCGSQIPADRLVALAAHFNDADRALKSEIDAAIGPLRQAYGLLDKFQAPDPRRLYEEFQPAYIEAANQFDADRAALLKRIASLGKALQEKKTKTTEALPEPEPLGAEAIEADISAINAILDRHDNRSREFQSLKNATAEAITVHYLSTIREKVSQRDQALKELGVDLGRRREEISTIEARVAANRASISSDHKACDQINQALRSFLGREELRFVPDESDTSRPGVVTGYRIMRGEEPASHLSEGERTAIAFVYFVVHLADGQFDGPNGIVVIDDPISSLDSNSVYQAFSYLKNAVKDCGQVFVFTHNFEFLKLLLTWREFNQLKKQTGYYMINNVIENGTRHARIDPMDRELCEYESEYHYLFKMLRKMRDAQDGSIAAAYPVANIARKLWETFLMFRIPDGKRGMHSKMQALKDEGFDPNTLDAITKFTNDNSHLTGGGFNPALVEESRKVVGQLLEMMRDTSPDHYRVLEAATV